MSLNSVPIRLFVTTIEKWVAALNHRDARQARFLVEQLQAAAEMLAIDPAFERLYRERVSGCTVLNAPDVIHCLCAFFNAVSDASHAARFRDDSDPQPSVVPA